MKKFFSKIFGTFLDLFDSHPPARASSAQPYWCPAGHWVSEAKCLHHPNLKPTHDR
jgi:hypothetical protein